MQVVIETYLVDFFVSSQVLVETKCSPNTTYFINILLIVESECDDSLGDKLLTRVGELTGPVVKRSVYICISNDLSSIAKANVKELALTFDLGLLRHIFEVLFG